MLQPDRGYSFEVDIWALGVVAYTLLVGNPPFQGGSADDTQVRIRNHEYSFPRQVSLAPSTKSFISQILQPVPEIRPTTTQLRTHPFFSSSPFPRTLPRYCITEPFRPEMAQDLIYLQDDHSYPLTPSELREEAIMPRIVRKNILYRHLIDLTELHFIPECILLLVAEYAT